MNMNNEIIQKFTSMSLVAIAEYGTSFDKIPKDSLMKFLLDRGLKDPKMREMVYQNLLQSNNKSVRNQTQVVNQEPVTVVTNAKQPRKSIFGEITSVH